MRRALTLVAVAATMLTACTATTSGTALGPGEFHDCSQLLKVSGLRLPADLAPRLSATCGTVPVPLDHGNPSGGSINIVAVRIHDSDNAGREPLLVNPGGPGASGIELALGLLPKLPADVLKHYDLVGFDPRGVGLSSPVECFDDATRDRLAATSPDLTTSAGRADAKRTASEIAKDCSSRVPGLRYYTTVATAQDIETLRMALGADRTNYLGFSYGTELGSVYAHLFPDRVGTFVLDGAVDPLTSGEAQFAAQQQGFEDAFDDFAASCGTTTDCAGLTDPRANAEAIIAGAFAHPLPTGTDRPLTGALAATGVLEALYARTSWPRLATALVAALDGDASKLLAMADAYNRRSKSGHYTNLTDANLTISCNDSSPGPTDAQIRATALDWTTRYPLFGKASAISLFTCQQWQPHRTVPPKPSADTSTPVLVVGNLNDPATPYQGAKDLVRAMGDARLLSWDGEGHTSYLSGSDCVDGYVTAFLVDGTLPPADTTCPRR